MIKIFIEIMIIMLLLSCSTKKNIETRKYVAIDLPEKSEIIENKIIGITDTTIAFLSGNIYDKNTNLKEPLMYVNVILTNKKTKKIYGSSTDKEGYYSIKVDAGFYEMKVSYIAYTTLYYELNLGIGELRIINIELSQ